ncbi:unnamed protein product [Urochloa humidicola]
MELKPRRGRLRKWAALLSALVTRGGAWPAWVCRAAALASRGGAWVRRAAAALRRRLARRPVVALVDARVPGESSAATTRDPPAPHPQEDRRRGRSPSPSSRRVPDDRANGEAGEASAALGSGSPSAPSSEGDGRRQESDKSPRAAAAALVADTAAQQGRASPPRVPEEGDPEEHGGARNTSSTTVPGDHLELPPAGEGADLNADKAPERGEKDNYGAAACSPRSPSARQEPTTPSSCGNTSDESPRAAAALAADTTVPGDDSELPLAGEAVELNAKKTLDASASATPGVEVRDRGEARDAASTMIPVDNSDINGEKDHCGAAAENTAPEGQNIVLAAPASPTASDGSTAPGPGGHNPAAQEGTGRERVDGINITSVENAAGDVGQKVPDANDVAAPATPVAQSPRAATGNHGESSNAASTPTIPGDNSEHGVAHGGEITQNVPADLDAEPGGSDAAAVLAQPDLAVAPLAGGSSSRARRRCHRFVQKNKAKKAPRQDQPLLQVLC